jgi:hypothetical protein
MHVCGVNCCAKWKNEKAVVQGLEPQGKAVKKVTKNPLNIGVTKFRAQNPPCETQICNPYSHTLGPFPMFPDRYCYSKLTSSSTGVKSEFWLFRSAFNCRILFFVFDFGGMIT